MNILKAVALALLLPCLTASAATERVINVIYGADRYTGSGVAGGGTKWNVAPASGGQSSNLLDSTGKATAIDFTTVYLASFTGATTPGSTDHDLLGSGAYGSATFEFRELSRGSTYDLYIYVYNKSNEPTTVMVKGASRQPSPTDSDTVFALNQNYVVFKGVRADAKGSITGTVTEDWTGLNGIQLVEHIPNPKLGLYRTQLKVALKALAEARKISKPAKRKHKVAQLKARIDRLQKLIAAG
jgi:hypothetical protein